MQLNQPHILKLREMLLQHDTAKVRRNFVTGLNSLDQVAPHGVFARGAIHEMLYEPGDMSAAFVAAMLARAASASDQRPLERFVYGCRVEGERLPENRCIGTQNALTVRSLTLAAPAQNPILWCDANRELYPPALLSMGILPEKLIVIHPRLMADEIWATAEALRCKGLAAVVASPSKLSRVEARRLQLAAEEGGTTGILLRCLNKNAAHYAAATRWLVKPMPGNISMQRWSIQLIHGHGGLVGKTIILERSHDIHHDIHHSSSRVSSTAGNTVWNSIAVESSYSVRAIEAVADRSMASKTA